MQGMGDDLRPWSTDPKVPGGRYPHPLHVVQSRPVQALMARQPCLALPCSLPGAHLDLLDLDLD